MNKFKVGDKVKIYSSLFIEKGVVESISPVNSDLVNLRVANGIVVAHRKQLRKLKTTSNPLEFWINVYPSGTMATHETENGAKSVRSFNGRTIHVREVKE